LTISRAIATLKPPLRWYWYVELWDKGQGGHVYAMDNIGYVTKWGCVWGFMRYGLVWLIRAWCL
jgi:hypothetical protein